MKIILLLILLACFGHNAKAYIDRHHVTVDVPKNKEEISKPQLDPKVNWMWDEETLCFRERAIWHAGGTYWCQIPDTSGQVYWQELPYTWHHNLRNVLATFVAIFIACATILFIAGILFVFIRLA